MDEAYDINEKKSISFYGGKQIMICDKKTFRLNQNEFNLLIGLSYLFLQKKMFFVFSPKMDLCVIFGQ